MTHLSSCLQLAGVSGHPLGGSAAAFAKSTARFEHDRPDGLEGMSDRYQSEMWRRLHIRVLLSRKGCFTAPHQDQLSTDSCIVLLAVHAGTGGRGQWRITLLDPSYLLKRAHTASADGDRAGAAPPGSRATSSRSPATAPPPSPRARPSRTPAACTPSQTPRWRRARPSGGS